MRVIGWVAPAAAALGFGAAPVAALAQAVSLPQPVGDTLTASSSQVSRWVLDVGHCPKTACITQVMPSTDFTAQTATLAQVDASEGVLNTGSHTPGPWNLSAYTGITFLYEDLNGKNSQGSSAESHYFLIYDSNRCYREWVINSVQPSGLPVAGSPIFYPNAWYQVTGSFATAQGQFVIQGGTPSNGVACNTKPLNYAAIIYFETGIFGGVMAAGDGVTYHWRVGAVTPFSTPQ